MLYRVYIEEVYEVAATSLEEVHEIIKNQDINDEWETKATFVGDSINIEEDKEIE